MFDRIVTLVKAKLKKSGWLEIPPTKSVPVYGYLILLGITLMVLNHFVQDYTGAGTLFVFALCLYWLGTETAKVGFYRYIAVRLYIFCYVLTGFFYFITPQALDVSGSHFLVFYIAVLGFTSAFFLYCLFWKKIDTNKHPNFGSVPFSGKNLSMQVSLMWPLFLFGPLLCYKFVSHGLAAGSERGQSMSAQGFVVLFGNENTSSIIYMFSLLLYLPLAPVMFHLLFNMKLALGERMTNRSEQL